MDASDDFADLDAMIASAMEVRAAAKTLADKRKRLDALARKGTPDAEIERQILLAAVRKLEEGIVWKTEAQAALFHTQTCGTCGSRHRFFIGLMTEQRHVTDRTATRLIRMRPPEGLPTRVVEHDMGSCEMCSDCVESCIIIQEAIDHAQRPSPPSRTRTTSDAEG